MTSAYHRRQSGTINVSTLASFLQKWLTPRLADLHAKHPDIDVRIHASTALVDFAGSDFHAAIRFGAGNYSGLRSEKMLDEHLVAIAAPALVTKYGPLSVTAGLDKLPLLHGNEIDWSSWLTGDTAASVPRRGTYKDDSAVLLSAVVDGRGFGILRWTLAAAELEAGHVVLASSRVLPHRYSYYFVCPPGYLALPKIGTLRQWLLEQARAFGPPPTEAAPEVRPSAAAQ